MKTSSNSNNMPPVVQNLTHFIWNRLILEGIDEDNVEKIKLSLKSPFARPFSRVEGGAFRSPYSIGGYGFFTQNQMDGQRESLMDELKSDVKQSGKFMSENDWKKQAIDCQDRSTFSPSCLHRKVRVGDTYLTLSLRKGSFRSALHFIELGLDIFPEVAFSDSELSSSYDLCGQLLSEACKAFSNRVKSVMRKFNTLEILAQKEGLIDDSSTTSSYEIASVKTSMSKMLQIYHTDVAGVVPISQNEGQAIENTTYFTGKASSVDSSATLSRLSSVLSNDNSVSDEEEVGNAPASSITDLVTRVGEMNKILPTVLEYADTMNRFCNLLMESKYSPAEALAAGDGLALMRHSIAQKDVPNVKFCLKMLNTRLTKLKSLKADLTEIDDELHQRLTRPIATPESKPPLRIDPNFSRPISPDPIHVLSEFKAFDRMQPTLDTVISEDLLAASQYNDDDDDDEIMNQSELSGFLSRLGEYSSRDSIGIVVSTLVDQVTTSSLATQSVNSINQDLDGNSIDGSMISTPDFSKANDEASLKGGPKLSDRSDYDPQTLKELRIRNVPSVSDVGPKVPLSNFMRFMRNEKQTTISGWSEVINPSNQVMDKSSDETILKGSPIVTDRSDFDPSRLKRVRIRHVRSMKSVGPNLPLSIFDVKSDMLVQQTAEKEEQRKVMDESSENNLILVPQATTPSVKSINQNLNENSIDESIDRTMKDIPISNFSKINDEAMLKDSPKITDRSDFDPQTLKEVTIRNVPSVGGIGSSLALSMFMPDFKSEKSTKPHESDLNLLLSLIKDHESVSSNPGASESVEIDHALKRARARKELADKYKGCKYIFLMTPMDCISHSNMSTMLEFIPELDEDDSSIDANTVSITSDGDESIATVGARSSVREFSNKMPSSPVSVVSSMSTGTRDKKKKQNLRNDTDYEKSTINS